MMYRMSAVLAIEARVQPCRLSGKWYPADPDRLRRELAGLLPEAPPSCGAPVSGLILPHAGYSYSAATAAAALRQVGEGRYRRVIVIGPSHQVYLPEFSSLPDATHYETPLGRIALDREVLAALLDSSRFKTVPAAHRDEHSVQIQLPLLQVALGEFKLVPVVTGDLTVAAAAETARLLAAVVDAATLVIASTDFTHYGDGFNYHPFREDVEHHLERLDQGAFEFIRQKDAAGFLDYTARTGATICGRIPVAVLLEMLRPEMQVHQAAYVTSGRMTGDFSNSVSYLSAWIEGRW